ncbi:hypothetical protein I7X13_19990 [Hymenobacter sp. BT442]|uniref:Lipoprotein n=2 Tax=Hymenobacter negativus TaxID=2795026 RepID=A0ABS0QCF9_9BACT|nr:hypothetical protein [Hymenobacter negativus]
MLSLLGLATLLTGCGSDKATTVTDDKAVGTAPSTVSTSPVAVAAVTFADSLASAPKAEKADIAAARAYAQTVNTWESSGLNAVVKEHPVVANVWKRYRYVLRTVVRSRSLKRVKPEDVATWNGFTPQCEEAMKMLVPLIQEPNVTATQALPTLQSVESSIGRVRFAAERHLMYLEHPYTRTL